MAGILVDTNVLVYAYDRRAPQKQRRAREVLVGLRSSGTGWLSAQCLAEFFSATTRGSNPLLSKEQAAAQVADLAEGWPIFPLTAPVSVEAVRGVR